MLRGIEGRCDDEHGGLRLEATSTDCTSVPCCAHLPDECGKRTPTAPAPHIGFRTDIDGR